MRQRRVRAVGGVRLRVGPGRVRGRRGRRRVLQPGRPPGRALQARAGKGLQVGVGVGVGSASLARRDSWPTTTTTKQCSNMDYAT